ncbi:MAG: DUF3810 domain-containing protein [Oscillospiraceae bacterium]|nr:DUF3810 domain-containing protein [Oscillospiraceae bacterium]MDE5884063.1 DUF3810 domain-containing protein [Oscillospiraceae bacterium]
MKKKLHLETSTKIMFGIWIFLILVNVLARFCTPAVDFYIATIFPAISDFWCSLSGMADFSVGEHMILAGIVLVFAGLMSFILFMIFAKRRRGNIAKFYGRFYGWILTWVFFVVTFHFLILYQGTKLSQTLETTEFENQQVLKAYELIVSEVNILSGQVERDETGHFQLSGNTDLMTEAKACMRRLSQEFPQYQGTYPDAKPIRNSYFFTQQGLLGIYYPFSMEANYNPVVYEINLPSTICHEYTHLKGNIFEDEAGYYAFRACLTSENPDFRYSGYINMLNWLELDFGEDQAAWTEYYRIEKQLNPNVKTDMHTFVPADYYQLHRHEEVLPTAIVSEVADTVMDTSLKVNGVPEGSESYHGLTALVLNYYIHG